MNTPIILWFRQDLRLHDHATLHAAIASGHPVLPLYIDDTSPDMRPVGGAGNWWRHHSLQALSEKLAACGAPLVLRRGPAKQVLLDLVKETNAAGVMWSRCYEPDAIARDKDIKATLLANGKVAESFKTTLLFEPWEVVTKTGTPYQVFTPFWKTCRAMANFAPSLPAPTKIAGYKGASSETLASMGWLPTQPNWATGFAPEWQPGEAGAIARLHGFIDNHIHGYKDLRDRPDGDHTSRLSPHLHWGEISPRQIWHSVQTALAAEVINPTDADKFLAEVGWREFAHHLLFHFPTLPHAPLQPKFAHFPWVQDDAGLKAWQRGQTGYPIVDAGMRQLWQTGWMHNRVRMIVASFLVKHLLIGWPAGESWFWDTLLDADLANNAASWQWVSGCGADAAPYFRIFNPIIQGEKFDPDGLYVKTFVPELAQVPPQYIHRPWEAPLNVLRDAGVQLGRHYPKPIVEHQFARDRALAALASLKEL